MALLLIKTIDPLLAQPETGPAWPRIRPRFFSPVVTFGPFTVLIITAEGCENQRIARGMREPRRLHEQSQLWTIAVRTLTLWPLATTFTSVSMKRHGTTLSPMPARLDKTRKPSRPKLGTRTS